MKVWYKLRSGAYFVDFLLLIAALLAIIGLATFVHLHIAKVSDVAGLSNTINMPTQHLDTLPLDTSNDPNSTTTKPTTGNPVDPANATVSSKLQYTSSAPESSSPAAACGKDCDSMSIKSDPVVKQNTHQITVQPISVSPNPCAGLVMRAMSTIQKSTDSIACTL